MLPLAYEGLERIGIDSEQANRYLSVIERRLALKTSGAVWQLNRFEHYYRTQSRDKALRNMLKEYMEYSNANVPVAEWNA